MAPVRVLMVAEKPSLAQSIARLLSEGQVHTSRRQMDVHEFSGRFQGQPATFKMTSVIGHIYGLDFPKNFQNWATTDPLTLFGATTVKSESNPKARVCQHLQGEARGCDKLVLWLDCDREGENICFEVMSNTVAWMNKGSSGQQVWRAKFSAISAPELKAAMANLGEPNKNESDSVDARQELDLKNAQVGVAFTRYQTAYFQGKYGNLDSSIISYGPCQTPTLTFCVQRHQRIASFQPEPFWAVRPYICKGGSSIMLEWGRGRVFDIEVCGMFQKLVSDGKRAQVKTIAEKDERKTRPSGLNTVEMLRVASTNLNIGPQQTMHVAERLYMQGYLSYPRTESSAYPKHFDFKEILTDHRHHPIWGDYARALLSSPLNPSKGGVDVGDHPPITPVRCATEMELGGGDEWRLYDFVARHFLASLSSDAVVRKVKVTFAAAGEVFTASGSATLNPGFTTVMPWKAPEGAQLPKFEEGEQLSFTDVELYSGRTAPPDYLTEAELITLMEKNGIGTDASIPVHINNICERNYASVQSGRRVVPTELGISLVSGYQLIDPELCLPEVRSHIESQIGLVAKGLAKKEAVVEHALNQFRQKFLFFMSHINRMDNLFEANFSPIASSGKVMSKCGKCKRYMKYIASRPSRLYCSSCEELLDVPQGGHIKLYKGLVCPLDGFELLLFSLQGADGKTYAICPYCFNHPPFEDVQKIGGAAGRGGGMACTTCVHPTCKHSFRRNGVAPCPECGVAVNNSAGSDGTIRSAGGILVLDPVSAPKWRLDCNLCNVVVYLPKDLHSVKVSKELCDECDAAILKLDWKKGSSPLPGGETGYSGCPICDATILDRCSVVHGKSFAKIRRGGGRARRGRGRGRGRRDRGDPKLSFDRF